MLNNDRGVPVGPRFHTLDGMRGFAALAVACHHLNEETRSFSIQGYLAVDLFFALSGFVIALNYADRLGRTMTVARFAELRLIRLYPLYAFGLLLGFLRQIMALVVRSPKAIAPAQTALALGFGAVMLPTPDLALPLFPLNGALWSLFFEIAINLAFAVTLFRLPTKILWVVVATAAAVLVFQVRPPHYLNIGFLWSGVFGGAIRTLFSFGAGMLIHRHLALIRRRTTWLALVPLIAMVAALLIDPHGRSVAVEQLVIVIVGFPALIVLGVMYECPLPVRRPFAFLGDISYPIYAIHQPLVPVMVKVAASSHLGSVTVALLFVATMVALGVLVGRGDAVVRRWLTRIAGLRRASAMPQQF